MQNPSNFPKAFCIYGLLLNTKAIMATCDSPSTGEARALVRQLLELLVNILSQKGFQIASDLLPSSHWAFIGTSVNCHTFTHSNLGTLSASLSICCSWNCWMTLHSETLSGAQLFTMFTLYSKKKASSRHLCYSFFLDANSKVKRHDDSFWSIVQPRLSSTPPQLSHACAPYSSAVMKVAKCTKIHSY